MEQTRASPSKFLTNLTASRTGNWGNWGRETGDRREVSPTLKSPIIISKTSLFKQYEKTFRLSPRFPTAPLPDARGTFFSSLRLLRAMPTRNTYLQVALK